MKVLIILLLPVFCYAQNQRDPVTAVEKIDTAVYPNPASEYIHLRKSGKILAVKSTGEKFELTSVNQVASVKELSEGLYFIDNKKIIIKKN